MFGILSITSGLLFIASALFETKNNVGAIALWLLAWTCFSVGGNFAVDMWFHS